MSNTDLHQEQIDSGAFLNAARLAIQFGRNCGSKAAAWRWAETAIDDMMTAKVTGEHRPDAGNCSWPDFDYLSRLCG